MASKDMVTKGVTKEKPQTTWNKSIRNGDNEMSVRVEKLSNAGFLVIVEKSGRKKGEYFCDTKKYYSEANPLIDEIVKDPFEELADVLVKI